MTDAELIEMARAHGKGFPRHGHVGTAFEDVTWVSIRECVIVTFENEKDHDAFEITLDRASGDMLRSFYRPSMG